jgi:hypothetical protein
VQPSIELGSQLHLPPAHQNSMSGNFQSNGELIFGYFASLIGLQGRSSKCMSIIATLNAVQNKNNQKSQISLPLFN